jgi:hypothetical protein
MDEGGIVIIQLIFRIVGAFVCANKAKNLNRNSGGWGFFGFVLPIVAMIWIHCLKPVTTWDNNIDIK